VEVLLSKHQVLAALRFIRGIGGHDSISARKFLDAAKQAEDDMLFYTIFRFFEQRNQRLRGNPSFTPGKQEAVRPGDSIVQTELRLVSFPVQLSLHCQIKLLVHSSLYFRLTFKHSSKVNLPYLFVYCTEEQRPSQTETCR